MIVTPVNQKRDVARMARPLHRAGLTGAGEAVQSERRWQVPVRSGPRMRQSLAAKPCDPGPCTRTDAPVPPPRRFAPTPEAHHA